MGQHTMNRQKFDLTKFNPHISKVIVGLGWDLKKYDSSAEFDLDASAFLLSHDDKVINEESFIFYNNLKSPDGSVIHSGNCIDCLDTDDDEQIVVEFEKVPEDVKKVSFAVSIHEGDERDQHFGMVSNAFFRIVDAHTSQELFRFNINDSFSNKTAAVLGELYRKDGTWSFSLVGNSFSGGLPKLCNNFGINV